MKLELQVDQSRFNLSRSIHINCLAVNT